MEMEGENHMGKRALAVISFGTTYPQALEAIFRLERHLAASMPNCDFFRAFTSRTVISRLKQKQGMDIMTPPQLLHHLKEQGYEEVYCQTLHIIGGKEYTRLEQELRQFQNQFRVLRLGTPMLDNVQDDRQCVQAVMNHIPSMGPQDALLLMGHGTEHRANAAYAQLESVFAAMGHERVYVGTAEGYPVLEDLLPRLQKKQIQKVMLMPFLIVAGDHARNDLAGDGRNSWKSRLQREGYEVTVLMQGLGDFPEIAQVFERHLQQCVQEQS